jgi:flavorubredoxin
MAVSENDLTNQSVAPYRVADGTWVVPQLMEAPPVGLFYLNSLVIQGREPVIVDTGTLINRDQWLEHVFSLVDPADVRWVFLSHDDADHTGNLVPVLEACPNAVLVTTWFGVGRMVDRYEIPMDRVRFVRDGDRLDAGDRTLTAVRPPLFDNPTTRGLFDAKTGVYWASDAFCMSVPHAAEDVAALDRKVAQEALLLGARLISPWHCWLDPAKWNVHLERVRSVPIDTIASCHAPAIRGGEDIDWAFELLRSAPELDPWSEFSQQDLDNWMAAAGIGAS